MAATVLVIDGGGRGSALVDKYLQSPHVSKVLAVPGNDLMLDSAFKYQKKQVKIYPNLKTTDTSQIVKIAQAQKVDLADVAQDDAVAAGVVDKLKKAGISVFGPTKKAGQIEWAKAWSRNFMKKFNLPMPRYQVCTSQQEGIAFIKNQKVGSWYIKASGLAAGKGSLYAKNNQEALEKIIQMKKFGKSGEIYLIEECLQGEEFSSFALVDGDTFIVLGHAQDHKKVYDGDLGLNTGGMGCSSSPMVITRDIEKQIRLIFQKTVEGLVKIDRPYRGVLYLGGMIVKEGLPRTKLVRGKVYVIEFNARWGDPEAQVIIPSIKNDLYEITTKVISGDFKKIKIKKDNLYRVVVTAASRGYPEDYSEVVGKRIFGLDRFLRHSGAPQSGAIESIKIFGAGVKKQNSKYIAAGGRLFYVMGEGANVAQARQKVYHALSKIKIEGNNLHYRTDIGWRDVERMRNPERNRRIERTL